MAGSHSVASLSAEPPDDGLVRLVGQHPAAIRNVAFLDGPMDPQRLYHLEIETKHGHVTLIHGATGEVFCNPPVPPDAAGPRQARDLTAELPGAFDGRPRISSITCQGASRDPSGYQILFSTGAGFAFSPDPRTPLLSPLFADRNK